MIPYKPDFIFLDHTADLGIKVRGDDLKQLFVKTALAMMHLLVKSRPVATAENIKTSFDCGDTAELMVYWLGEILYLFHGEKKVANHIEIDAISPLHIDATLGTVPFDPKFHEILYEIKAATYHQIEVNVKDNGWESKIIFDL